MEKWCLAALIRMQNTKWGIYNLNTFMKSGKIKNTMTLENNYLEIERKLISVPIVQRAPKYGHK
jgi:hypothetical protein